MKRLCLILLLCASASATCIPPKGSHCVDLSWIASPTAGVTYNVYRSTTQGQACLSAKYASGITTLTFSDLTVNNGSTYYYAISASGTGGESVCTVEVQTQIPSPPQPPSAPIATVQ